MIPALILLAAAPAQAAPMSYEDALQRALDRNPELLGASESRQSAEGALMAAKATFDPTLTASTGWTTPAASMVSGASFPSERWERDSSSSRSG